jgi:hypothetical protein
LTRAFDESLLAMENRLYDQLLASLQDQSVGLYAHMNILEHECGVNSPTKSPTPPISHHPLATQPFQEQEPPESPHAASNLEPSIDDTAHIQDQEPSFQLQQWI